MSSRNAGAVAEGTDPIRFLARYQNPGFIPGLSRYVVHQDQGFQPV